MYYMYSISPKTFLLSTDESIAFFKISAVLYVDESIGLKPWLMIS